MKTMAAKPYRWLAQLAVNIVDFITLAAHFENMNATWEDGDLNYDRQVTFADFMDLVGNFETTYAGESD